MIKNRRGMVLIGFLLLVLSTMACSLSGLIPGTGGGSSVSDLWPDVPRMDGMTLLKEDLPLEVRVMVQAVFTAASDNQGNLNFVAYTTAKTPAEVVDFYTTERMKSAGWQNSDQVGCLADTSGTTGAGGICLFGKETGDNSGTLLAIVPSVDSKTQKTSVFFARIDFKDIKTATPQK
jgi:hypothetical protein